jgi:hypothetical protein
LLDRLAQRFIAHGWSVKKLIAEIMNSHVYQLSSSHDETAFELDPANRFHWRMNRRRLDSDAIRDAIRQVSGELDLARPEPQIALTPSNDDRVKSMDLDAWFAPTAAHRTVYQPVLRDCIPDDWSVFDFPDPELVADLKQRGMLDETLIVWAGEFGRTPFAQFGNGRDHNNRAFTIWMAGGGVKPGTRYGLSDEYGREGVEGRVHIHDLHATILHQLGLDHEKLAYRYSGRDFRLTDVKGRVVTEVLA